MKKLFSLIKQRPWLSGIIIIYAIGMIAISVPKSMEVTEDSDHFIVWQAGKDFSDGNELYYRLLQRPLSYPPFTAFVSMPLHSIPLQYSALILFLLNSLILLPIVIYLVYKILLKSGVKKRFAETVMIIGTIITMKYMWNNLVMFQINLIIATFIILGIYFLSQRKPHIAGSLFVFITLIKIIPIFLAAYVFVFHFSKRVVLSMIITLVLCLSIPPLVTRGWVQWTNDHVEYFETFLKPYVIEGKIVTDEPNHSLKAGVMKTFFPETREIVVIWGKEYPVANRLLTLTQGLMLLTLIAGGVILFRRKQVFSLSFLAAIVLFTHLFAGITWTAHLVTFIFCLTPVLLIDRSSLKTGGKLAWFIFIGLMIFLGIEGSDTTGDKLYLFLRYYDIYTYLLVGLFIYYSWIFLSKKSRIYFPEAISI